MKDSIKNKAVGEFEVRRPSFRDSFLLKLLIGPDTVFGTRLSGELNKVSALAKFTVSRGGRSMNKPFHQHMTNNQEGGAREHHKSTRERPLTLPWTLRGKTFKLRPQRQVAAGQERLGVEFRKDILG